MTTKGLIKLVECPRDAMQGWKTFIPTQQKIKYLNTLLKVGFDTLDCGSFVSANVIPQMADTAEVIAALEPDASPSKLLVIVANTRGAEKAVLVPEVTYLGFPLSVSETFQQRNANSSIAASLVRVEEIQSLCVRHNKQLVVYLSMGFGNPYGDEYNQEILLHWAAEIASRGIRIISLADTIGIARPEQITTTLDALLTAYPNVEFGVHLHSTSSNWKEKFEAALHAGCTRFDGALRGIGGCPMAGDALVGNMNTEWMINYLNEHGYELNLNEDALEHALTMAAEIFN